MGVPLRVGSPPSYPSVGAIALAYRPLSVPPNARQKPHYATFSNICMVPLMSTTNLLLLSLEWEMIYLI